MSYKCLPKQVLGSMAPTSGIIFTCLLIVWVRKNWFGFDRELHTWSTRWALGISGNVDREAQPDSSRSLEVIFTGGYSNWRGIRRRQVVFDYPGASRGMEGMRLPWAEEFQIFVCIHTSFKPCSPATPPLCSTNPGSVLTWHSGGPFLGKQPVRRYRSGPQLWGGVHQNPEDLWVAAENCIQEITIPLLGRAL